MFNLKNYIIYINLLIYTCIALIIANSYDYEVFNFTTDFEHYHNAGVSYLSNFGLNISDFSIDYCDSFSNCFIKSDEWDHNPLPFYPILFISSLTIFGSKILFTFQGIFIGIINLYLLNKIAKKYLFSSKENNLQLIWSLLLILNPTIFLNTLGSSPMSILLLFILLGINTNKLSLRYFFFGIGMVIRATSIIYLISYLILVLINKPDKLKKHIFYSLILIIVYYFCFQYAHHNYQLSPFSALFIYESTPYSDWQSYIKTFLEKSLGVYSVMETNMSFSEFLNLIKIHNIETINLIIQNFFVKFSIFIGFQYDGLARGGDENVYGIVRLWKSFLLIFVMLPGVYNMAIYILRRDINLRNQIKLLFIYTFIVITFSSLLIANTRYVIPIIPLIIYSGIDYWIPKRLFLENTNISVS